MVLDEASRSSPSPDGARKAERGRELMAAPDDDECRRVLTS
jgi:hypothetical protein